MVSFRIAGFRLMLSNFLLETLLLHASSCSIYVLYMSDILLFGEYYSLDQAGNLVQNNLKTTARIKKVKNGPCASEMFTFSELMSSKLQIEDSKCYPSMF